MLTTYFFLSLYSICMIVLAILWLQSGLDKVFHFKDNYDWLKGHFSKSPLKGLVKIMLLSLTLFEVSAGISALIAIIDIWVLKLWYFPLLASFLSMFSLTALFFGQRIAKDYAGAASLVGYMIYSIILMFISYYIYVLSLDLPPTTGFYN